MVIMKMVMMRHLVILMRMKMSINDDDNEDETGGDVLTLETKVRRQPLHCDQHSKPFVRLSSSLSSLSLFS